MLAPKNVDIGVMPKCEQQEQGGRALQPIIQPNFPENCENKENWTVGHMHPKFYYVDLLLKNNT